MAHTELAEWIDELKKISVGMDKLALEDLPKQAEAHHRFLAGEDETLKPAIETIEAIDWLQTEQTKPTRKDWSAQRYQVEKLSKAL